jgi:hypothetical protein
MSSKDGGIYCNLMGAEVAREDVTSIFFLGYSISGEPYSLMGEEFPAVPEDFALAAQFSNLAEELLADGSIKAHPASVRAGGLEGIIEGMEEMKRGKISGEKLVYMIGNAE